MKRNAISLPSALAVLLAMSVGAGYAKSWRPPKSPPRSAQLTISSPLKLADGVQLGPGTYRLELSDNPQSPEALFYKDGALIARSPVKLESQPQKFTQTEILSNNQGGESAITETHPRGWTEKLVLSNGASDTAKIGRTG
jgi:hypothetical protein